MVSLTTDSPQRNATVITIAWPSVLESVLRVRLRVTVFCILALPRVTLGITAKKVNFTHLTYTSWDMQRVACSTVAKPLVHAGPRINGYAVPQKLCDS